jgi:hypothetical protein
VTFFRVKRVKGRGYVYEMESYRTPEGKSRSRIVRYVGALHPVHGRPPVDLAALRAGRAAIADDGRGRSPEERRLDRQLEREDAKILKSIRENSW